MKQFGIELWRTLTVISLDEVPFRILDDLFTVIVFRKANPLPISITYIYKKLMPLTE